MMRVVTECDRKRGPVVRVDRPEPDEAGRATPSLPGRLTQRLTARRARRQHAVANGTKERARGGGT